MQITKSELKQSILLTEGGEGIIYKFQGKLIKVYKDSVNKNLKEQKIQELMKSTLPKNIIKPLDIIYDNQNKFIGYLMDFVDNAEEIKKLSSKKFVLSNNITVKDISLLFCKVQEVVKMLHDNNIYISDFNDCNIIFDKQMAPYFIDVDSWSIGSYSCDVAMDSFLDPLFTGIFSERTDNYSFSILLFKSLTRVHPFGGTLTAKPNMNLIDRMRDKLSIIERLDEIIIPPTSERYFFMKPDLLKEMKDIFDNEKRNLIGENLFDFSDNLMFCKKHMDYYYSKYDRCPICEDNAKIKEKPEKKTTVQGIPYRILFAENDCKLNIDYDCYITNNNNIFFRNVKKEVTPKFGQLVYSLINGNIVFVEKEKIYGDNFSLNKQFNTNVLVKNDSIYYVYNNSLNKITITEKGNYSKNISIVSNNCFFDVYDDSFYFICNSYDNIKILNINGYNHELKQKDKILNYGIHFDEVSKLWLFIFENKFGKFYTYVFKNNELIYKNDEIIYTGFLGNIEFNNKTIIKASDKKIVLFNYEKNVYKDLELDFVDEGCKLIKKGNKMIVISEKIIYEVG